jgi:hypothetical protein
VWWLRAPGEAGGGDAVSYRAGASFRASLQQWFKTYSAAHQHVLVDYQSVGSGSGVKASSITPSTSAPAIPR